MFLAQSFSKLKNVEVGYICDVDNDVLAKTIATIEKQTGKKVYNILQLRLHPAIIELKKKIAEGPKDKIYDVEFMPEKHIEPIGKLICTKKEMMVSVLDGYIKINSLQFPGKKKMTASEFLNGIVFSENAIVC